MTENPPSSTPGPREAGPALSRDQTRDGAEDDTRYLPRVTDTPAESGPGRGEPDAVDAQRPPAGEPDDMTRTIPAVPAEPEGGQAAGAEVGTTARWGPAPTAGAPDSAADTEHTSVFPAVSGAAAAEPPPGTGHSGTGDADPGSAPGSGAPYGQSGYGQSGPGQSGYGQQSAYPQAGYAQSPYGQGGGIGQGESYAPGGSNYPTAGYGQGGQPAYPQSPSGYGEQQPRYDQQQRGYGSGETGAPTGYDPSRAGYGPYGYAGGNQGQSGYPPQSPYGYGPGETQAYGTPTGYGQQQPGYGQSGYAQHGYAAAGYAPSGYGQAGGYPSGYGQPEPKKRHRLLWTLLILLLIVIALVIAGLVTKKPSALFNKRLSHTAVENYISSQFGTSGVVCNGGHDITVKAGNAFTCTAGGRTYRVTIVDNNARYQVQPPS